MVGHEEGLQDAVLPPQNPIYMKQSKSYHKLIRINKKSLAAVLIRYSVTAVHDAKSEFKRESKKI